MKYRSLFFFSLITFHSISLSFSYRETLKRFHREQSLERKHLDRAIFGYLGAGIAYVIGGIMIWESSNKSEPPQWLFEEQDEETDEDDKNENNILNRWGKGTVMAGTVALFYGLYQSWLLRMINKNMQDFLYKCSCRSYEDLSRKARTEEQEERQRKRRERDEAWERRWKEQQEKRERERKKREQEYEKRQREHEEFMENLRRQQTNQNCRQPDETEAAYLDRIAREQRKKEQEAQRKEEKARENDRAGINQFRSISNLPDYYAALGLNSSATKKEIRKAYLKSARTNHPDKNKDDKQATEQFKQANEAHQILMNDKLKRQYDEERQRREKEKTRSQNTFNFDPFKFN